VSKHLSSCLALILLLPCLAIGDEIKVGFVDIPYLIDEAPQAQAASVRLEQEFAPRQDAIKARKRDLDKLRQTLEDGDLNQGERLQIEREFNKTERRVKRDEQDFREELNIQKNEEFKQVRIIVLEAIAAFAKQNEYDLIISDGVLFANKRIDVTEEVLEQLQQTVDAN
jgi:outer membrane protein